VQPDWPAPRFDALSTTLVVLLLAYMFVVGPLLGLHLRRRMDAGGLRPGRFYVEALAEQWLTAAVTLVVVGAAAGVGREHVGLANTRPGTWWWTLYAVALGAAVLGVGVVVRRRILSGHTVRRPAHLDALLPRTPAERRLAAVVAVSAGVCEELVYRGLLLAVGVGLLGLHPLLAGLLALVAFTVNHVYQGWVGMLGAAAIGFACTGLCLWTGSLLPAVILHVAIDLRGLLLLPPREENPGPATPPAPGVLRSRSPHP
jgi:membrane protease YdiL (CAAX protease family)